MTQEKHLKNVEKIHALYKEWEDETRDYDDIWKDLEKIHNTYLKEFQKDMLAQELSVKTIGRHISNVDFFVNVYLFRYMEANIFDGASVFMDFFGYYYIRKNLCSSVNNMKAQIASIKKFYRFLYVKGYLTEEQFLDAEQTIKDHKDEWLEEMREYDEGIFEETDWE